MDINASTARRSPRSPTGRRAKRHPKQVEPTEFTTQAHRTRRFFRILRVLCACVVQPLTALARQRFLVGVLGDYLGDAARRNGDAAADLVVVAAVRIFLQA